MKTQGRGAKALTIFKYTLALLATIALLKLAFFPTHEEEPLEATGDFSQPTAELSPRKINNTIKLSASILPDEPTTIRANASGEITDAYVNSGGFATAGQALLQVKKTEISEAPAQGGSGEEDQAPTPTTTVKWGNITSRASGTVQWNIVVGQTVEIGQELGTISPRSYHAVASIKPNQLYSLGDTIKNGRLAITDGPAPFLCDDIRIVTAGNSGTPFGAASGTTGAAQTGGSSASGPQLRCSIPGDQTVYEGVPATLILGGGAAEDVQTLPVTAVEGRFREGTVYLPGKNGEKPKKVKVELGVNDGKFIEIKNGLKPGQQVLKFVPSYKDDKADKATGSGGDTDADISEK